ncbi:glutamate-cysteine ligase family protein [Kribbella sp. NPDC051718]|uniref:glutamate-cysteine ligase family protein n=1 Tax=Kribbella sp. NPDC051718 TaxID=3155168 RepID=UPI003426EF44
MDTKELWPLVAGLFARSRRRTTRIAVEQEFLVADTVTGAAVPIDRVRQAARTAHAAPYITFEPVGQLELSLPCAPDPAGDLCAYTEDLQRHLTAAGIQLEARPCDPRPEHEVPLQLTTPRYVAMHRHFDTMGPAGRRMMRRTASTQICLDWWPGAAGIEQWRVLNLAGPFLAARFARSSGLGGRLTTWLRTDPARTGFDDRPLRGDPVTAYAEFAAAAKVFVTGGAADHLTTLFPPVRPRGTYLEVRFLDAQQPTEVGPVIAALAGLMYDDDLRRRTLRLLESQQPHLADHWHAAAMGDPGTADRCRRLLPELEPAA